MQIARAVFRTTCGTKTVELCRAREGEAVELKMQAALADLYARKKRHVADFISSEIIDVEVLVLDCFDRRGMLIPESNVDFLFDALGCITVEVASKIRAHMMEPGHMPFAHTDLARLFYAIEAQRISNMPAENFFK